MAKMINKHKLKGTETRADIVDRIGGAGGGARKFRKPYKNPPRDKDGKVELDGLGQPRRRRPNEGKTDKEIMDRFKARNPGMFDPRFKDSKGIPYGKLPKSIIRGRKEMAKRKREKAKAAKEKAKVEKAQAQAKKPAEKASTEETQRLYGDWLPKGERPYTAKQTPSADNIRKASKDYY